MRRLGIITGLQSEARLAKATALRLKLPQGARHNDAVIVCCAGPGLANAAQAAETALARGAQMLVSFGIAGALQPELRPGSLILPRRIIAAEGPPLHANTHEADAIAFAASSAVRVSRDDLVSVGLVVSTTSQKQALAEASKAVAVDMESYAVARIAARAQVPFLALRALADPWNRTIPPAAQKGMGPRGNIRPIAVLLALTKSPKAVQPLAELARDQQQAMRALGRAARLAFPVLLIGR